MAAARAVAKKLTVTARVISGVASHIQVEETEALHVSRIALMVRGYLRSECVKELLSQAQDSSLTHSTLQLRATMSAIRHPCLIMGQCPSNFEGRNTWALPPKKATGISRTVVFTRSNGFSTNFLLPLATKTAKSKARYSCCITVGYSGHYCKPGGVGRVQSIREAYRSTSGKV